jgi:serine/threonine protein kinase
MKLANSAYIIKYYKTNQECKIKNKLLMEYIPNSLDLYNFVERNKQTLNLTTKFIILANIANGLRFLKNQRIVHMDLTPKNILIGSGLFTKIIDFGEAYCDKINTRSYKPGFTNPYGPP